MGVLERLSLLISEAAAKEQADQFIQITLAVLIYLTLLLATITGRRLLLQVPLARQIFLSTDYKYARYVYFQIIEKFDGERRYSFLHFIWDPGRGQYRLKGFQYDPTGLRTADFESNDVAFPTPRTEDLEFVWKATLTDSHEHFGGFTHMRFDDAANRKYLEGSGFFITFDKEPQRYNLVFRALTRNQLRRLNVKTDAPRTHEERKNFVLAVHKELPDDIKSAFLGHDLLSLSNAA